VLRLGDLRAFLGALQPQFALVVALVQIAEVGLDFVVPAAVARRRCEERSGFRR
jgi:hypothetical protein